MIDFKHPIVNLHGEQFRMGDGDESLPVDLAYVCVEALLAEDPNDSLSGDEKFRRYKLAEKIHSEGQVSLKAEDVSLLKRLVAKRWVPAIMGPAWERLDPTEKM